MTGIRYRPPTVADPDILHKKKEDHMKITKKIYEILYKNLYELRYSFLALSMEIIMTIIAWFMSRM